MRRLWIGLLALPLLSNAQQRCAIDGIAANALDGSPVPRVNVTIAGNGIPLSTRADDNGHWSFTDIPCGNVYVSGARAGQADGRPTVLLTAGSPVHGFKIRIMPPAVVTGKVTDDHGDPVIKAGITAFGALVIEGRRTLIHSAVSSTNDAGEFRLANLPAGRYTFCASRDSTLALAAHTMPAETCYPAPPGAGPESAMRVAAGAEVNVNLTVTSVPAFHVRGKVTGAFPGKRVDLALRPASGLAIHYPPLQGGDGSFDLPGVRPGAYVLQAFDNSDNRQRSTGLIKFDVGDSDVEGLVIPMEPFFDIAVTVKVESKTGISLKAPVDVEIYSPELVMTRSATAWNQNLSAFTLPGVFRSRYVVVARPPPPLYLKSALLNGRDISAGETLLGAAGTLALVFSDASGVVEGDVTTGDHKPAACGIMLLRNGKVRTATSGDNGHFRITGVPPGDYTAYAWSDSNEAEYADAEWLRKFTALKVTVDANQTRTLKLTEQVLKP